MAETTLMLAWSLYPPIESQIFGRWRAKKSINRAQCAYSWSSCMLLTQFEYSWANKMQRNGIRVEKPPNHCCVFFIVWSQGNKVHTVSLHSRAAETPTARGAVWTLNGFYFKWFRALALNVKGSAPEQREGIRFASLKFTLSLTAHNLLLLTDFETEQWKIYTVVHSFLQ